MIEAKLISKTPFCVELDERGGYCAKGFGPTLDDAAADAAMAYADAVACALYQDCEDPDDVTDARHNRPAKWAHAFVRAWTSTEGIRGGGQ